MRNTVPASTLVTQTSVSVAMIPRGPRPTEIGCTAVAGDVDAGNGVVAMLATQTAVSVAETLRGPSPTATEVGDLVGGRVDEIDRVVVEVRHPDPDRVGVDAGGHAANVDLVTTVLVAGSMRSTVVASESVTQTLSSAVAMRNGLAPVGISSALGRPRSHSKTAATISRRRATRAAPAATMRVRVTGARAVCANPKVASSCGMVGVEASPVRLEGVGVDGGCARASSVAVDTGGRRMASS